MVRARSIADGVNLAFLKLSYKNNGSKLKKPDFHLYFFRKRNNYFYLPLRAFADFETSSGNSLWSRKPVLLLNPALGVGKTISPDCKLERSVDARAGFTSPTELFIIEFRELDFWTLERSSNPS